MIRKFSPSEYNFTEKLDLFIAVNRFIGETELLFMVSEFLEVEDILNFTMVSKELRFLVEIPLIENRILRMKLSMYENPRRTLRIDENS